MTKPRPEFKAPDSYPVLFPLHHTHLLSSPIPLLLHINICVKKKEKEERGGRERGGEAGNHRDFVLKVLSSGSGLGQVISFVLAFFSGKVGCEHLLRSQAGKVLLKAGKAPTDARGGKGVTFFMALHRPSSAPWLPNRSESKGQVRRTTPLTPRPPHQRGSWEVGGGGLGWALSSEAARRAGRAEQTPPAPSCPGQQVGQSRKCPQQQERSHPAAAPFLGDFYAHSLIHSFIS